MINDITMSNLIYDACNTSLPDNHITKLSIKLKDSKILDQEKR